MEEKINIPQSIEMTKICYYICLYLKIDFQNMSYVHGGQRNTMNTQNQNSNKEKERELQSCFLSQNNGGQASYIMIKNIILIAVIRKLSLFKIFTFKNGQGFLIHKNYYMSANNDGSNQTNSFFFQEEQESRPPLLLMQMDQDFSNHFPLFCHTSEVKALKTNNISATLQKNKDKKGISYSQNQDDYFEQKQKNALSDEGKKKRKRKKIQRSSQEVEIRKQESAVKQKQRDDVWNIIKQVYKQSINIPNDQGIRKKFYQDCFLSYTAQKGSDVRIFEAYARPSIFGRQKQVEILKEIRQKIKNLIQDINHFNEILYPNPIYRDALLRWMNAHTSTLTILIQGIGNLTSQEERIKVISEAINCYQEEGALIKGRKKHEDVAQLCLQKYMSILTIK